ncbi:thiamine phosphate synthase [Croceicoccus sp. F390]|uniref:Thiamine phosphate synthase n=1 Tax=Croceicoccus esteveae TaxID=3075597 RepID=A0ABU2ZJE8_9SPHN|nr:thiamine phosphate synthase [Croceicoccus sp. F390]MDT0576731.1 thiamine phosphate synthase [Croceicoccus sp. F390]
MQRPVPGLWLVSDDRNDDQLAQLLRRLPSGCGLIFRHYHLAPEARRKRFDALRLLAHAHRHVIVLADAPAVARKWRADGVYGAPARIALRRSSERGFLRLATAHSLAQLAAGVRTAADLALLSPVYPTRTHPGAKVLGPVRALLLARQVPLKVAMLGGMTRARARRMGSVEWAAIDGLGRCPSVS